MNPLNYATLEASKRLHDAGIVLETEHWHGWDGRIYRKDEVPYGTARVPAPTIAEVLRELPESKELVDLILEYDPSLAQGYAIAILVAEYLRDINKMIGLLIWEREKKQGVIK